MVWAEVAQAKMSVCFYAGNVMSFLSFAIACWTSWGGWFGNLAVAVGAGVLGRKSYSERTRWRRQLEIVCFGWVIVLVD